MYSGWEGLLLLRRVSLSSVLFHGLGGLLCWRWYWAFSHRLNSIDMMVLELNHKGNEVADESATTTATATVNPANPPYQTQPLSDENSPLLVGRDHRRVAERRGKVTLAALYAVQVFYSFFIM